MELVKTLTLGALLLPFARPTTTAPQDAEILKSSDLLLEHYMPRFAPAEDLTSLAYNMAGVEREVQTGEMGEIRYINNLFTFGDSVLLYDTPDAVKNLSSLLQSLDESYAMTAEVPESRACAT